MLKNSVFFLSLILFLCFPPTNPPPHPQPFPFLVGLFCSLFFKKSGHCYIHVLFCVLYLHRALKTKGNTPKYGLIFHSTFIGRAGAKNKGRISRYLANKCSIASRIDCFAGIVLTSLTSNISFFAQPVTIIQAP